MGDDAGRVICAVPFCRRSALKSNLGADTEHICGVHWRMVPKIYRRVYARISRRYRRGQYHDQRIWKCRAICWGRIKRAAIEAAGGIG